MFKFPVMKKVTILLLPILLTATLGLAGPAVDITLFIGGPGSDLAGSGIARIAIGSGFGVTGSVTFDEQTSTLILRLSAKDIQYFQPEKLKYFDQQNHVFTCTDIWRAPQSIVYALEARTPIVIPPGVYPYTIDKYNNYVIPIPQRRL